MNNFTKLASCVLIAFSGMVMAQGSANSNNRPSTGNNGYYYDFKGTAADNCPAKIPYDQWNIPAAYSVTVLNDTLTVTTTGAQEPWHKLFLKLTTGDCQNTSISIGQNQNVSFKVISSVAVPQCILWLGDQNEVIADDEPIVGALVQGENTITTTDIKFGIYNGGNAPTVFMDSTNVIVLGLSFRNAWDNGAVAGTFKIPYIGIGDLTGITTSVVESAELASSLSVYPSPASSQLEVSFHATDATTLTLFDVTGATQLQTMLAAGENHVRLNVSALKSGLYNLNINSGGKIATKKVVIE